MLVFVFIVALMVFYEMKITDSNEFHKDYISPKSTSSINGLFTILIFLSHSVQYIDLSGVLDAPYVTLKSNLGQMVVVTFLFYSGYGIMESIKKKGIDYVKSIPTKRFLKVLRNMAIAVTMFLILNLILGIKYDIKRILLAYTGWTSIGNSNWYIFAVLILYVITFISFMIFRKNHYIAVVAVTALTAVYVYVLMIYKIDSWYYDTVIMYSMGMWYSLFKDKIERIIMKNDLIYTVTGGACVALYYLFFLKRKSGIEWYTMWGVLFMALVVLFTMKIKIGNRILDWFGTHVFSVYILQRIPMIILKHFGLNESHKYAFIVVSLFATIVLAEVFDTAILNCGNIFRKPKTIQNKES